MTCEVLRNNVSLDEEVVISYVIRGGKDITMLDLPNFHSFQITNEFQSYRTEYINSNTPTTSFTKTFTLKPMIVGSFTFPKARAIVDGFTVYSEPVKVTITKGKQNSQYRIPVSLLRGNETPDKKISDNIEVVQDINKTTCYVGENIISTIKLYARLEASYNLKALATYNGFSIEDKYFASRLDPKIVQYKGLDYSMNEIRAVHLFPLNSGELTIEPLSVEATVPLQREINPQQYETFTHTANLVSNQIKVNVLPLPTEGKPSSFNGAVGNFTIASAVESKEFFAEELYDLVIWISGEGNLPLIHLPKWDVPSTLNISQTQIITDYIKNDYPFKGTKKFVIPFYVKEAGTVTIPSISFSYFDPKQKQYNEIRTEALELNVKPATVQNRKRLVEADSFNYKWLFILIPIGILGLFIYKRNKQSKEIKSSLVDTRTPSIKSRLYFDETKKAYWNNQPEAFYKNLKEYIVAIIEEKDNVTIHNEKSLSNYLNNSTFSAYQQEMIMELFSRSQLYRYSQFTNFNDHQSDFQKFERLSQSL